MEKLTLERAIQLAKEIVDPNPEFVYVDEDGRRGDDGWCKYIHHYQTEREIPGCLVGQILSKAGATNEELHSIEGRAADELWKVGRFGGAIDYDASSFLGSLQVIQDVGGAWGFALTRALLDHQS